MESTSPKKLRAELKDYLDLASKAPIRIHRRSGESFILITEDGYTKLQNEVQSLQRRLLSLTEIVDGKTLDASTISKAERLKRFKK